MTWLLLFLLAPAAAPDTVYHALRAGELAGGRIVRTEAYEGSALAGYMNGGAELYREYGFRRMTMQQVRTAKGDDLTVEVFLMDSPLAAFGVYSISRRGCVAADSTLPYVCAGPYQVQGVAGPCYVRIQSVRDTRRARDAAMTLIRALSRRLGRPDVPLSALFAGHPDTRVLMGVLGLQNGMPDLEGLMDGFTGYVMEVRGLDEGEGMICRIVFAGHDDARRFAVRNGIPGDGDPLYPLRGRNGAFAAWESPRTIRILEIAGTGTPDTGQYRKYLRPDQ